MELLTSQDATTDRKRQTKQEVKEQEEEVNYIFLVLFSVFRKFISLFLGSPAHLALGKSQIPHVEFGSVHEVVVE